MLTPFTTGSVFNVRLNYAQNGKPDVAFNVLHYRTKAVSGTQPGATAALAAIGSAMFAKWAPLWSPAAGADVSMLGVTVANVFPAPRSVGVSYIPLEATPGDQTGDAIPLQDAPTLLKKTEIGQRWGSGRLYYVGLGEAVQDEGMVIPGAAVTALSAMGAALKDEVTVTGTGWSVTLEPVLVSGPEDNPTRLTLITNGYLSDRVIKTQRRRRPGKGI